MNVYEVEDISCYSQKHMIVAKSQEMAAKLWKAKYLRDPIGIKLISEFVIIQGGE